METSVSRLDVLRKMVSAFPWSSYSTAQMQHQRRLLVTLERIVQGCRGFVSSIPLSVLISCGVFSLTKGSWMLLVTVLGGLISGYVWYHLWVKYVGDMIHVERYHQSLLQGLSPQDTDTYGKVLSHIRLSLTYRSPWLEFHVYQSAFFLVGFAFGYVFFRFGCNVFLGLFLHRPFEEAFTYRQDIPEIFLLCLGIHGSSVLGSVGWQIRDWVAKSTSWK